MQDQKYKKMSEEERQRRIIYGMPVPKGIFEREWRRALKDCTKWGCDWLEHLIQDQNPLVAESVEKLLEEIWGLKVGMEELKGDLQGSVEALKEKMGEIERLEDNIRYAGRFDDGSLTSTEAVKGMRRILSDALLGARAPTDEPKRGE